MPVTEGDRVPCVYLDCEGTVTIDEVWPEEPGEPTFCEGTCDDCGRRVDFDYDPVANPHSPGRMGARP